MPRLAFVTCAAVPDLTPDDQLAAAALNTHGATVASVVWDDPAVDWQRFDALALRSTWDYHQRPDEFRAWLAAMDTLGVPLWNPAATVRWNMQKTYLRKLAAEGLAVVETEWLLPGQPADLHAILARRGWAQAVVKPVVSASAHNTWRTTQERAAADRPRLEALLANGGALVQPFLEEIQTSGEWSLLFFGREYSHAVLKKPAAGDFRVQNEYGGGHEPASAPPELIRQAAAVLASVPGPLAYARVDGVVRGGAFVLMELELIEPYLFLNSSPGAADRFAAALFSLL